MTWQPQPVTLRMNNALLNAQNVKSRKIRLNTHNRLRGYYKEWGDR